MTALGLHRLFAPATQPRAIARPSSPLALATAAREEPQHRGTVLVFGGYGGFGARLSRRLAAAGLDVVVAGRRRAVGEAFCAGHPGCRAVRADRGGDVGPLLRRLRPRLVIDAAGPFQGNGAGLPRACIAAGVSYLDLADGRDFVGGIGVLDAAAKAAGVVVLSGASSVPALSGAVCRYLAEGLDEVTAVEMAISASNRATAGTSVAASILSYAGRPVPLWRGRRPTTGTGWQELRAERFALEDGTALGRRWTALVDVPDLALLPERLPGHPSVVFRAGTDSALQTVGLFLASWSVRWGWLPSLSWLAPCLLPLQRLTARWASDRSGMIVRLFGRAGPRRIERRWTLLADDGRGPEVPVLAAAILAGRILAGAVASGARDAGTALDLADFAEALAALSIRREVREIALREPLVARLIGQRFDALAPQLAALHGCLRDGGASGVAVVERDPRLRARLAARLLRLPPAGGHALHLSIRERGDRERWRIDLASRSVAITLTQAGTRLLAHLGLIRAAFDLASGGGELRLVPRGWSLARVPMPSASGMCLREWEGDGRIRFRVAIALPVIGPVARIEGWLRVS